MIPWYMTPEHAFLQFLGPYPCQSSWDKKNYTCLDQPLEMVQFILRGSGSSQGKIHIYGGRSPAWQDTFLS